MMTRTQAQPEAQARTRTPKPSPARGLGAWRLILALGASYFMLKCEAGQLQLRRIPESTDDGILVTVTVTVTVTARVV